MNTAATYLDPAHASATMPARPQSKDASGSNSVSEQSHSFASMLRHAQKPENKPLVTPAAKPADLPLVENNDASRADAATSAGSGQSEAAQAMSASSDSATAWTGNEAVTSDGEADALAPGANGSDLAVAEPPVLSGKSTGKLTHVDAKSKAAAHQKANAAAAIASAQPAASDGTVAQPQPQLTFVTTQRVAAAAATGQAQTKTSASNTPSIKVAGKGPKQDANVTQAIDATMPVDATKGVPDSLQAAPDAPSQDCDDHGSLFAEKTVAAGIAPSFAVTPDAATPAPAATFRLSLQEAVKTAVSVTHAAIDAAVQASATANDSNTAMQTMPAVRHLEVAVNDPVLGSIGVRAEMRAAGLHASISGAGDMTAVVPQLHGYLQQHAVVLHSVSFTSANANDARPQVTAASSNFSGSMDSSSANQSDAQQRGDARAPVSEWKSAFAGYNEDRFSSSSAARIPTALLNATRPGSTVSIHI